MGGIATALTSAEWLELQDLLGVARGGTLDWGQQQRLRRLLSKQSPSALGMGQDELVRLGLFLVGLHAFVRMVLT